MSPTTKTADNFSGLSFIFITQRQLLTFLLDYFLPAFHGVSLSRGFSIINPAAASGENGREPMNEEDRWIFQDGTDGTVRDFPTTEDVSIIGIRD
jgi:hypothetical protein